MPRGGKRPGAGRPAGPQAIGKLTIRLGKQREQLAQAVEKAAEEDGVTIWETLVAMTKSKDETVAMAAMQLVARHTLPVPAQKANLACIELPEIRTTQDAADAMLMLAAAGASGHVEPQQLKEVTTALEKSVEVLNQVHIERELQALRAENADLRKCLQSSGRAVVDYTVVSGIGQGEPREAAE